MGYYQGDLYRGDFLGAFGKIFSAGRRIVGSALGGLASRPSAASTSAVGTLASLGRTVGGAIAKRPVLAAAGASAAAGLAMAGAGKLPGLGKGKMKVGKDGAVRVGRERRRMHATNAKALRRALRRAYAFERIAMRTIHLLHPRKRARFGGFKRHRRKAA